VNYVNGKYNPYKAFLSLAKIKPTIDHQGIVYSFVGEASVIRYFFEGEWLILTGSSSRFVVIASDILDFVFWIQRVEIKIGHCSREHVKTCPVFLRTRQQG
jgi:hypothetical protein